MPTPVTVLVIESTPGRVIVQAPIVLAPNARDKGDEADGTDIFIVDRGKTLFGIPFEDWRASGLTSVDVDRDLEPY